MTGTAELMVEDVLSIQSDYQSMTTRHPVCPVCSDDYHDTVTIENMEAGFAVSTDLCESICIYPQFDYEKVVTFWHGGVPDDIQSE